MIEGQQVTWTGPEDRGHLPGDEGQMLTFAGRTAAHVLWSTGAYAGQAEICDIGDLQAGKVAVRGLVDDALDLPLTTFAVRETFDSQGEEGVLSAMAVLGHLGALGAYAQEALDSMTSKIRHDPAFREVIAALDDDEADSLVNLAATCLIRDAFGENA